MLFNFTDASNKHVLAGYIKELLHSANLPSMKIFNNEDECNEYFSYTDSRGNKQYYDIEVYVIIKNFKIDKESKTDVGQDSVILFSRQTDTNNQTTTQYVFIQFYLENLKIQNLTRNLYINNSIYDTYTHTYLGDFLRYVRDYYDINLMSLYNCYANETQQLDYGVYKYIVIPVKYGETYTMAFENSSSYSYLISTDNIDTIMKNASSYTNWTKIKESTYQKPYLVSVPKATSATEFFKEHSLKLVVRVYISNTSSIVCLEGDYTAHPHQFVYYQLNYEKNSSGKYLYNTNYTKWARKNRFTSNLQLLKESRSDGSSYAFADRLIEYLVGRTITPHDKIKKNIVDSKYNLYTKYMDTDATTLPKLNDDFSTMLRFMFFEVPKKNTLCNINDLDLLGYVDKDIEFMLDDDRYPIINQEDK